jgi:hypothetical protein
MPTTGGATVSFEVYRSTTAGTVYLLANKITSIPVVAGQTAYSYLDSTDLTPGYWVVSAKNAGGETASAELTVAKPVAPASFAIAATVSGLMSETLTWSPPASGENVASYEVYRSTTAPAFDPANLVISIPAVSGQASYTFVDDAGLTHALTYWTVSAKNIGGQTAYSPEASATPTGDSVGYGNNFSAGLIFADNIGIGGLGITGTWTNNLTTPIDYNTGLRPTLEQVTALAGFSVPVTVLPYLDSTTIYTKSSIDYYPQKTASTWQGEWVKGASTLQNVNAAWGDNLVSQSLTANSKVRIEMVLSEGSLITPLTSYPMVSLYGAQVNEVQGTTGPPTTTTSAFVFASNARMKIEKLLPNGTVDGSALYDVPQWS